MDRSHSGGQTVSRWVARCIRWVAGVLVFEKPTSVLSQVFNTLRSVGVLGVLNLTCLSCAHARACAELIPKSTHLVHLTHLERGVIRKNISTQECFMQYPNLRPRSRAGRLTAAETGRGQNAVASRTCSFRGGRREPAETAEGTSGEDRRERWTLTSAGAQTKNLKNQEQFYGIRQVTP